VARKAKPKPPPEAEPEADARPVAGEESPSCLLRSLPDTMLVAAADKATAINPVNAPPVSNALMASVPGPEAVQFLAMLTTKYWGPQPRVLSVSFMETTAVSLQDKIILYMNAWKQSGCVGFKRTAGQGDVRISRGGSGYWSYLGTDILLVPRNQPTMTLQGVVTKSPDDIWSRVVPHEAGHSLGYIHEHLRAEFIRNIDPVKCVAYFQRTYGWSAQMTNQNVLTPLDERTLMGTPADQDSVMAYQLPAQIMRNGEAVRGGTHIIPSDHEFNARVYPKPGGTPRDVA